MKQTPPPSQLEARRLQVMFDDSPLSIQIFGPDGRTLKVNKAWKKLWNVSDEFLNSFILKEYNVLTDPILEKQGVLPVLRRAFAGETVTLPRVKYDPADMGRPGRWRWTQAYMYPIKDDQGRVLEVVLVHDDITDYMEVETHHEFIAKISQLLAASLDFQTTLTTITQMAVPQFADWCVVDILEEGKPQRLAAAHKDPRKLRLAEELAERYPPKPHEDRGVNKVLRTGESEWVREIPPDMIKAIAVDDEHLRLLKELGLRSYISAPLTARGKTLGVISFVAAETVPLYEKSDLEFAEEMARVAGLALDNARLFQKIERVSQAKDHFLAALSHELRTPLSVILGWIQTLLTGSINEDTKMEGLKAIERNANLQFKLISDLLDISRIISGKLELENRLLNLSQIAEETINSFRPAAQSKNIALEFQAPPLAPLKGDWARLQQILTNLLSNAMKFTPEGGQIHVSVDVDESFIRLIVKDTGQGIDAQFLPHVFESFQQEDFSTTRTHGGLGLGLSIASRLAKLHEGTIEVSSDGKGKGTTFTVKFPVASRIESHSRWPQNPTPKNFQTRHLLRGVHVLLVDDAPDILQLITLWLKRAGAKVTQASSSQEALGVLQTVKPDVLLSDIGMPGEDGYSLIKKIRALPAAEERNIPAAALTAYARDEEEAQALGAGFQLHLTKPVTPQELISAVLKLARPAQNTMATKNGM